MLTVVLFGWNIQQARKEEQRKKEEKRRSLEQALERYQRAKERFYAAKDVLADTTLVSDQSISWVWWWLMKPKLGPNNILWINLMGIRSVFHFIFEIENHQASVRFAQAAPGRVKRTYKDVKSKAKNVVYQVQETSDTAGKIAGKVSLLIKGLVICHASSHS